MNQWESKGLHEHPAKWHSGVWGHVCLSSAGVYFFRVGATHMSCPQEWASGIQAHDLTEATVVQPSP